MNQFTRHHSRELPGKARQQAILFNCLFPGMGFIYLGKWKLGCINTFAGLSILVGCLLLNEPKLMEHIHWVILVVIVGSGSWVRSVIDNEPVGNRTS